MGCGCGKSPSSRSGRAVRTSGDYTTGSYMTPTVPVEEPLAVLADGVEEIPEGARYRVVLGGEVAYFGGHAAAFSWQGEHGGKLRTV